MLTEDEKDAIRQSMDALRAGIEGFRSRRPQLQMVAAAAHALSRCRGEGDPEAEGAHIALIEAGTGTGKSFGALVPALVMARSRGKRLVVSTSTVALQYQYIDQDVPTLQRLLPVDFSFAVAKGRRRYVCTAKLLAEAEHAQDLAAQAPLEGGATTGLDEGGGRVPTPSPNTELAQLQLQRQVALQLAQALKSEQWNGDRDELPITVSAKTWEALSTDRQGCCGRRCSEFARCPFYAARQQLREADLIIANHDLLLATLESDAGGVLPPPHEVLFVIDEAHNLASKVVDHFAAHHTMHGAVEWIESSAEAVRDAVLALELEQVLLREAQDNAGHLAIGLNQLFQAVHASKALEKERTLRFKAGELPDWLLDLGHGILAPANALQKVFATVRESILERAPTLGPTAAQLLSSLGFFAARLNNLLDTWELLLAQDPIDGPPVARWIERRDGGATTCDYAMCASPISGSEKLRSLLWSRASAAVLMSATLSSCGSFDLFRRKTGLDDYDRVSLLQVESPFDYRRRARLVIDGMRADTTDPKAHTAEIIQRMPDLVHSAGTLMIFASGRQMHEVYEGMPADLREITLMQGAVARSELLTRHRQAIDAGARSVLFGLQSLAEGVDLPREYCTHVIVAKLPFNVPDSPIEQARAEWVEAQGQSAFLQLSVPEAGVRLKQILGRLLRTDEDHGTVTILDRRVVSKRWGRLLLKGLPAFQLVVEPVRAQQGACSVRDTVEDSGPSRPAHAHGGNAARIQRLSDST